MRKELKNIDIKHNLKIYGSTIWKYKLLFLGTVFLILCLEGLRIVDKFLFKIVIDQNTFFTNGSLLVDDFAAVLVLLGFIFIAAIFLKTIGDWLKYSLMNTLEGKMIFDVKSFFFQHILQLSHKFHTTHKTGSLIVRLLRGSAAIERMTDVLSFNLFPLIFQFIVVLIALLSVDLTSAVIVVLTLAAFVIYTFFVQHLYQKYQLVANKIEDREKGYISDVFQNVESIKYFGKERSIIKKFRTAAGMTRDSFVRSWNFMRWMDGGQTLIAGLGTFFLLYFSLLKLLSGELTIGTIVFIYTVYGNLLQPLYGFVYGVHNFYTAMADFDDLFHYAKISNDVKDRPQAPSFHVSKGAIHFRDLSFMYHQRFVLQQINLFIRPHEKIAFVGHSGSGKSTLVKLLYRFYDPTSGDILIDNVPIQSVKQQSLRGELSVVPQECALFDDTIYNNIAFSNPDATSRDVWRAICFAQLDTFIKELPERENTIVGERGIKLSGGEKQRVSIARALLANKKILVLDEATSALDSKTEHDIQRRLQTLMKGRTVIIIAHRLSTIMHADRIVVLEKGKIVQQGPHHKLIKQHGVYQQLWRLQKGGYIQ